MAVVIGRSCSSRQIHSKSSSRIVVVEEVVLVAVEVVKGVEEVVLVVVEVVVVAEVEVGVGVVVLSRSKAVCRILMGGSIFL